MIASTERQEGILARMEKRGTCLGNVADDADIAALHDAGKIYRRASTWDGTEVWALVSELQNWGKPDVVAPAMRRLSEARAAEKSAEALVVRLTAQLRAAEEASAEATARVVAAENAMDDEDGSG